MASNDETITIYGKKRTFRPINGKYYEVKNGKVSKNPSTSFLVTSNLPKLQKSSSTKPMGFMTDKPSGTVKKPEQKPKPKTKKVPTGMGDRKTKPPVLPTPRPPVPKAKAKPTGMADRKPKPQTKTDGNAQAYRPGRGDSKLPPKTKDAKNPDAAYKSARDKQRRAGKLSNESVRDTSIKDARPARGPAYDNKAPDKQKPNARALKQIQERKDKAKNPLSKVMLNKITKELKEGGKPVYKDGMVVGVTHKGLIGTVYTGRPDSNPFKKKKKKK